MHHLPEQSASPRRASQKHGWAVPLPGAEMPTAETQQYQEVAAEVVQARDVRSWILPPFEGKNNRHWQADQSCNHQGSEFGASGQGQGARVESLSAAGGCTVSGGTAPMRTFGNSRGATWTSSMT